MAQTDLESEMAKAISTAAPTGRFPLSAALLVLLQLAAASLPVAGAVWFIEKTGQPLALNFWTTTAIAGTAALLATVWARVIHRRCLSGRTRSVVRAVEQVMQGELSIEDLLQITGGIDPLVCTIQELLRVQKKQKAELLEMEQEVRGRIANRTDALERKIGSLRNQAMRDVLTGLLNRRSLEQEMPRFLTEHQAGRDACLLMVDVDHFKALNDTLGHVAGDQLLKEIGQIIRSTIRDNDLAFRCGGDEFIILLHDTSPRFGKEISNRLESLVEVLAQPLHLELPPQLSIGICALSELEEPSAEAWLEVADKRLYCVKSARKTHRSGSATESVRKTA